MYNEAKLYFKFGIIAMIGIISILVFINSVVTVEAGKVKVATLYGKVKKTFEEGFYVSNPLYSYSEYDVKQKTHLFEGVSVPSSDQQQTKFDVSVIYRIDKYQVEKILLETGKSEDLINVHLIPIFRSSLRESGKNVKNAEDFFSREVQQKIQLQVLNQLIENCKPKGILVQDILIRNIQLPPVIVEAVEKKKRRQQLAEEQKAELIRFKVEQEQKLATARAERLASEEEAKKIKLLADAKAYQIREINQALGSSPAYLKYKGLDALKEISKNPASQIYFLNADSPQPFPLMNIGK